MEEVPQSRSFIRGAIGGQSNQGAGFKAAAAVYGGAASKAPLLSNSGASAVGLGNAFNIPKYGSGSGMGGLGGGIGGGMGSYGHGGLGGGIGGGMGGMGSQAIGGGMGSNAPSDGRESGGGRYKF